MADLIAKSALEGVEPVTKAGITLAPEEVGPITRLTLKRGAGGAALKEAHGIAFPAPNRVTGKAGARTIRISPTEALLIGPEPDAGLTTEAYLTDQTDGFTAMTLTGDRVPDLLARLTPLDLRPSEFKRGHAATSLLGHIPLALARIGATAWLLLVPRSMAGSAHHEIAHALTLLEARVDAR